MNILDFYAKKKQQEKITMVTCYDYTNARILAQTAVDSFLVGDSVAMTMHGHKDTISATLAMMELHTKAVSRGAGDKCIISDLPFMSYRKSLSKNVSAAQALIQAGAHAVKLEAVKGNESFIKHLTESGIPVMGHIGLTPQFIHSLGGFRVQGKTDESASRLKEEAFALQALGCFALVLECVPSPLAKSITESLTIPTIGIGAGPDTDGQVLVMQDLLGMTTDFRPKFVKHFMHGSEAIMRSVNQFVDEVRSGEFPENEHCYQR